MKYQPDPYVCKISKRPDDWLTMGYNTPLFNTWAEAHGCLIDIRSRALKRAEAELRVAQLALKRAHAMQPPKEAKL